MQALNASFNTFIDKNPVQITGAVKSILNVLIIFAIVHWSADELAAVMVALELVMGLFITSRTVNGAKLDELAAVTPITPSPASPTPRKKAA